VPSPEVETIKGEPAGLPGPIEGERIYLKIDGDPHQAIMTRDDIGSGDLRWHISLSRDADCKLLNHEVPVWRNLVAAVHHLRPGVAFMLGIPPRNQWMNLNPCVLHAYEVRDEKMEKHFRIQHDAAKALGSIATEPS
jgi:hypothetical protein